MSYDDDRVKAWAAAATRKAATNHRSDGRWKLVLGFLCLIPTFGWYAVGIRQGARIREITKIYWDACRAQLVHVDARSLVVILLIGLPVLVTFGSCWSAHSSYQRAASLDYQAQALSGVKTRNWVLITGVIIAAILAPAAGIVAAMIGHGWIDQGQVLSSLRQIRDVLVAHW